ncbi:MAG: hypothetical protein LC778_19785 [Acidobacteria bacterium]|nr:hypothetical protein [Acidobacteriota bacterium]
MTRTASDRGSDSFTASVRDLAFKSGCADSTVQRSIRLIEQIGALQKSSGFDSRKKNFR